MTYTVRYCHLKEAPKLKINDTVNRGDIIGIMGSSGQSDANHLHIDCIYGVDTEYTLADMEAGTPKPAPRQLNHFIDDELFGIELFVTSYYADPEYQRKLKKVHLGYDVVPADRHKTTAHHRIRWNRSVAGKVMAVRHDDKGYGHHVYISFDTEG